MNLRCGKLAIVYRLGEATLQLKPDKLDRELVLNRNSWKLWDQDELDQLVASINDMQVRLFKDIEKSKQVEKALAERASNIKS